MLSIFLGKQHPTERLANDIAERIQKHLTRLGVEHTRKSGRGRHAREHTAHVQFLKVLVTAEEIWIKVDTDRLPRRINLDDLDDSKRLRTLRHSACGGRNIRVEEERPGFESGESEPGFWYVVDLDAQRLPRSISYEKMTESAPESVSPLTIPFGIGNKGPAWFDLRKLPHLLIAGVTGFGKSNLTHAILCWLLQHLPPDRLHLALFDLKDGLELSYYKPLEHTKIYTSRLDDVPIDLQKVQAEMERRGRMMEGKARDLDEFNSHLPNHLKIPYLVVVIDEFASATQEKTKTRARGMLESIGVASESIIADLARRGRAMGVHLIVTTQRPDTGVISGQIKGNMPTRVCFNTASAVDSRVVIDDSSATGLKPGHMKLRLGSKIMDLQAPLLPERTLGKVIDQVREGVYLAPPESKADRQRRERWLMLDTAERECSGKMSHREIARLTDLTEHATINHLRVLEQEGIVTRPLVFSSFMITVKREEWEKRYSKPDPRPVVHDSHTPHAHGDSVLSDMDAAKNCIDGDYEILPQPIALLTDLGDQVTDEEAATIQDMHRRGCSRNDIATTLGGDRRRTYKKILAVLGPAERTGRKGAA